MRSELQLLQARLGFTAIFVTHDQQEALSLSDRIVIMNRGLIEQAGTPQDIFQHPKTAFTARFLGYSNALDGRVAAVAEGGAIEIDLGEGLRLAAHWRADTPPQTGDACIVAFRPSRVQVQAAGTAGSGLPGKVETAAFLGSRFDYAIKVGAVLLQAEGSIDRPVARGDAVAVRVPPEHCHAFPASE
jgi:ABC-type Fe3+/spermidine/putrescine transport system ATPase subunit